MSDEAAIEETPKKAPLEATASSYPFEGVAALILVLGATIDELPRVWDALKFVTLPRDPVDAVKVFLHAIEQVQTPAESPKQDQMDTQEITPDANL